MDIIDFSKNGGFRFEQPTLDKMQVSYFEILEAFIGFLKLPIVGNFIISGCEISGANITKGYMYIDGDLCPLEQSIGDITTKIKKDITLQPLAFYNGTNPPIFRKTTAVIDNTGTILSDFIRVPDVPSLTNELTDWSEIQNIPAVVIDPAVLTSNPPQKTVLQRLEDLENFAQGKFMIYLLKGNYPIGDAAENEDFKTITFSNVGTTNYTVLGELVSKGNYAYDNDITFAIREKTATSFKIILNDTGTPSQIQDLEFNYILVKN